MLNINLLPIAHLKRQAQARTQLQICFSALVLVLLTLIPISSLQSNKASILEQELIDIQQEHERYKPILKQISELKKDQKELKRKIAVIKALDHDSSLTVHVLDQVAKRVDSSCMWLTTLNQQGSSLRLTGVALDNQTIASFMDDLETSRYIGTVNLANASLRRVAGRNLKSFSLQCSVMLPQEQDTAANKQSRTP